MSNDNAQKNSSSKRITISIKGNVKLNEINEGGVKFKKKKSKPKKAKRKNAKLINADPKNAESKNAEPNENEKRMLAIEGKVATFSSTRTSDRTPSKLKSDQAARPSAVVKSTNSNVANSPNLSDFKDTLAFNTSYVRSTSSDVGSMSEFEKINGSVGLDMENKPKEKEIENLILKRKVKRKKSKARNKKSLKSGTGKTNAGNENGIAKTNTEKERGSPEKKQKSSKEIMSFSPSSRVKLFASSISLADFDSVDKMKTSNKSKHTDSKGRSHGFDENF